MRLRIFDSAMVATGEQALLRLATLVELGINIVHLEQGESLIGTVCRAAHNIIPAKYAVIGIYNDDGKSLREICACGFDKDSEPSTYDLSTAYQTLSGMLREHSGIRLGDPAGHDVVADFPANHPHMNSFLAVAIQSRSAIYGWIYVADKLGGPEFTADDERIAHTLAAQFAVSYENKLLFEQLQESNLKLQQEAAERKSADERVRRLAAIVESSHDAIISESKEGTILTWNRGAEKIYGYSAPEAIGRPISMLLPPEHEDESSFLRKKLLDGESVEKYETKRRRKAGGIIHVAVTASPIVDETGETVAFSRIARDITQRKLFDEALREKTCLAALTADVATHLAEENSLRTILDECATAIVANLDAAFARVWTLNEKTQVLELQASAGLYTHLDGAHSRIPVDQFKIGKIAAEQKPHLSNDVQSDPRVSDKEWARREGMVSFAGYPLLIGKRVVGVMAMFARKPLTDFTLRALGSIADTIAISVDRMKKHDELIETNSRFKQLSGSIREVFFLENSQHAECLYVSPAYEEIWGRSCQSLYDNPMSWAEAILPEDRARIFKDRPQIITEPFDIEYRILRPDGSLRWIRARGFPIRDNAGNFYRFAGIAEDITERKHGAEIQARLAAIVESSEDAIIGKSLDGRITSWNRGAERLFGYEASEILGHSIEQLIPADRLKEETDIIRKVRNGEHISHVETIRRRKDGSLVDVSLSISPIRDHAGNIVGVSKIARDITDRKKLETQLRQAQKMEAIGVLAGGVAHDFNNLLTVINGRSQLMMKRFQPGDKSRNDLELIYKTGERAATLTGQLLAFSRKQVMSPVILDLNSEIAELDKMLRRLIPENIELASILDPALMRVKADPSQIDQVIMNLVVNARDAMANGGKLTIETANVELSDEYCREHADLKPGEYVMLAVSDTGHGMDAAVRARIFEPFFTTKPQGKGTGLGLATVFGIVKQSNGHISVYSEVGKGTTFKVYLPRATGTAVSLASVSHADLSTGQEVVLVVEDEEGVRELICELLKMNGYTVLAAGNGIEALQLCERHKNRIDLLLTDVVMPEMGGPEFVEKVKASHPEAKALFTSGYTDHAIVRHGELAAGVAFIQKPFTPAGLTRKVRDVLDTIQLPRI